MAASEPIALTKWALLHVTTAEAAPLVNRHVLGRPDDATPPPVAEVAEAMSGRGLVLRLEGPEGRRTWKATFGRSTARANTTAAADGMRLAVYRAALVCLREGPF